MTAGGRSVRIPGGTSGAAVPGRVATRGARSLTASGSSWDLLTAALAGAMLQYVWRVQEYLPLLAMLQFAVLISAAVLILFLSAGRPGAYLRWGTQSRVGRLAGFIVLLSLASVPTSVHTRASVEFMIYTFLPTVVLAAVLMASLRDRRDIERGAWIFVLGGAAYVGMAMLRGSSSGGRLSGMGMYDPNDLGLFTVATIPLCAYLARRGQRTLPRLVAWGAALLLLVGLVRTGSRGGFLALVALGAYALLGVKSIASSKRLVWAVLGGAALLAVTGPAYWERMSTILSPQEDYNWGGNAESGRIEIWKRGLGYMARRPLTGVGVDQFAVAEGNWAPQAGRQAFGIGFKWSTAHSAYVQIGAELGVFGLAAFVGLLFYSFRTVRRLARSAPDPNDRLLAEAFAAVLVTFGVGCAFISQAYSAFLFFFLAILIAFDRIVSGGRAGRTAVQPSRAMGRRLGRR